MKSNDPDYVEFGEVARKRLGMQCQYASRYVGGHNDSPDFSQGLRFKGEKWDYHSLLIHKDDVEEFVRRAMAWRIANGIIADPNKK